MNQETYVVLVIYHLVLRDSTHLRDQNSQQPEGSSSGKAGEGSEAVPLPSRELTAVSDSSGSLTGPGWELLGRSQHVQAIGEEEYKRATWVVPDITH